MKIYTNFNKVNKNKQNLREFPASKSALQEVLGRSLQAEMKGRYMVAGIDVKKCRALVQVTQEINTKNSINLLFHL